MAARMSLVFIGQPQAVVTPSIYGVPFCPFMSPDAPFACYRPPLRAAPFPCCTLVVACQDLLHLPNPRHVGVWGCMPPRG
jgi:hypothetical protein